MGTDETRKAVYRDSNDLLDFFRETNEMQKAKAYPQLESYPLEAKIALTWTGNDPARGGYVRYSSAVDNWASTSTRALNLYPLIENEWKQISEKDYNWKTVSVRTLKQMRDYLLKSSLARALPFSPSQLAYSITNFVYSKLIHVGKNTAAQAFVEVDGERTINYNIDNADYHWRSLTETDKFYGTCSDARAVIDALLKAYGIPTIPLNFSWDRVVKNYETGRYETGHAVVLLYDSLYDGHDHSEGRWRTSERFIWEAEPLLNIFVFRIPIRHYNYFRPVVDTFNLHLKPIDMYYKMERLNAESAQHQFYIEGIGTGDVKSWTIYYRLL